MSNFCYGKGQLCSDVSNVAKRRTLIWISLTPSSSLMAFHGVGLRFEFHTTSGAWAARYEKKPTPPATPPMRTARGSTSWEYQCLKKFAEKELAGGMAENSGRGQWCVENVDVQPPLSAYIPAPGSGRGSGIAARNLPNWTSLRIFCSHRKWAKKATAGQSQSFIVRQVH